VCELRKFFSFFFIFALFIAVVFGFFFDEKISHFLNSVSVNKQYFPVLLFFSTLSINVFIVCLLVFLTFRFLIKILVEKSKKTWGSSLKAKLVSSFVFFSLVPTLTILYVSFQFVNVKLNQIAPENFYQTILYKNKLEQLVDNGTENFLKNSDIICYKGKLLEHLKIEPKIDVQNLSQICSEVKNFDGVFWKVLALKKESYFILKHSEKHYVSIVHWEKEFKKENGKGLIESFLSQNLRGMEIIKFVFICLLVLLSLLIIFSAFWVGVTLANEMTVPIQVLSLATERISEGNYDLKIQEIINDDELGQLARNFISMSEDLSLARTNAQASAGEMLRKANALEFKSIELENKNYHLTKILENIEVGVLALSTKFNILQINQKAEKIFRITARGALNRSFLGLGGSSEFDKLILSLSHQLQGTNYFSSADFSGKILGLDFQLGIKLVKLPNVIESNNEMLVFLSDFTELAKAQRLAAWREVAKRMAHEIKNPLTPIQLSAQRVLKKISSLFSTSSVPETEITSISESLQMIVHSSESIRTLVDEFVLFSRMPLLNLKIGNLCQPAQFAVRQVKDSAVPISFVVKKPESIFMTLFDFDAVVRMLGNIISNAMAALAHFEVYEEQTFPQVTVVLDETDLEFQLSVCDNGPGIPENMKDKIFEPYFSTKRTGMGLGLVIVQQILSEHKWTLSVVPNAPRGTIFLVSIPKPK
jgi:two-component system, NtrC family, nitrogen regulation sensor histidine kinase NtrY